MEKAVKINSCIDCPSLLECSYGKTGYFTCAFTKNGIYPADAMEVIDKDCPLPNYPQEVTSGTEA